MASASGHGCGTWLLRAVASPRGKRAVAGLPLPPPQQPPQPLGPHPFPVLVVRVPLPPLPLPVQHHRASGIVPAPPAPTVGNAVHQGCV